MTFLIEGSGIPSGRNWLNALYKKILRSRLTFKNVVLEIDLESADSNQKF